MRSGQLSHVPNEPMLFPLPPGPGGLLSRGINLEPEIWNTHGFLGKRCNFTCILFIILFENIQCMIRPQKGFLRRQVRGHIDTKTLFPIRNFYHVRQPEIHSTKWREELSRKMVQTNKRLQISELHFDKFPPPQTFSFWKIRFKIDVCICSNFLTEAMLWIKEVVMINLVDDLKSSCSIQGITPFPDFQLLDARIAPALNKIFQNSYFKKMVSLEEENGQ